MNLTKSESSGTRCIPSYQMEFASNSVLSLILLNALLLSGVHKDSALLILADRSVLFCRYNKPAGP